MNVISLSGASGVGENVVTLGLGPGVTVTPNPPSPRPRRVLASAGGADGGGGGGIRPIRPIEWKRLPDAEDAWREARKARQKRERERAEGRQKPAEPELAKTPPADPYPRTTEELPAAAKSTVESVRAKPEPPVAGSEPRLAQPPPSAAQAEVVQEPSSYPTGAVPPPEAPPPTLVTPDAAKPGPVRWQSVVTHLPGPYPRPPEANSSPRIDPGVAATPPSVTPGSTSGSTVWVQAGLLIAAGAALAVLVSRPTPTVTEVEEPAARRPPTPPPEPLRRPARLPRLPALRLPKFSGPYPRTPETPPSRPRRRPRAPYETAELAPSPVASIPDVADVVAYPPHASIQEKWIRCGKDDCNACPHGPYLYAKWDDAGRTRTKYLGKRV